MREWRKRESDKSIHFYKLAEVNQKQRKKKPEERNHFKWKNDYFHIKNACFFRIVWQIFLSIHIMPIHFITHSVQPSNPQQWKSQYELFENPLYVTCNHLFPWYFIKASSSNHLFDLHLSEIFIRFKILITVSSKNRTTQY